MRVLRALSPHPSMLDSRIQKYVAFRREAEPLIERQRADLRVEDQRLISAKAGLDHVLYEASTNSTSAVRRQNRDPAYLAHAVSLIDEPRGSHDRAVDLREKVIR